MGWVARVEKQPESVQLAQPRLRVQLLGPLAVFRDGSGVPLPASRKARALLAFLALAPRPVARAELCDLLWDAPSDPRGELRWSLSKIRGVLDAAGRSCVRATADTIELDVSDCHVDAIEVARATQSGVEALGPAQLRQRQAFNTSLHIHLYGRHAGRAVHQRAVYIRGCYILADDSAYRRHRGSVYRYLVRLSKRNEAAV